MTIPQLLLCVLVFIALFVTILKIRYCRLPQPIREAHNRLNAAVHAVNGGGSSDEDLRIVKDAVRVGMVRENLGLKDGVWWMTFSRTPLADELLWSGQYPTIASLDEELEEFRVS